MKKSNEIGTFFHATKLFIAKVKFSARLFLMMIEDIKTQSISHLDLTPKATIRIKCAA